MTVSEVRETLDRIGVRPSRQLGQNFLTDSNILRIIVAAADVRDDETVIEIGPGLGALTAELVSRARRVVAVEKDARLCRYLRERFAGLELIEGDAVEVELPACDKVVANLPYSISTPILERFVEGERKPSPRDAEGSGRQPRALVLTLQREVAQRLGAAPRTKDYGALTLFTQLHYHVTIAHVVSPRCFFPEPKVESAVVVLDRRDPRVRLRAGAPFHDIVRAGFSHRRKMLGKLLEEFGAVDAAIARRRAEELSLDEWIALANGISKESN
jgi:16S rRNA (adenine1518-N6/adenine1519-N6)-dimethyltransferase